MIKLPRFIRIPLVTIITFTMSMGHISWAQTSLINKPLTTVFFVDFAQKLFDRGEYDEAQSLLKKVLRVEPENSPVKRLLKSVESEISSNASPDNKVSRPSDIASDIMFIQKNIVSFERQNRDLEFAIRKILQENMFLYQTLSRRNQELLSLRNKFLGNDDVDDLGEGTDRDQLISESLNEFQEEITRRDQELTSRNQEIARKMKEAGRVSETFEEVDNLTQEYDSSVNSLEWTNDLTEKRAYLLEKAVTLFEKNRDLLILHNQLIDVSQSLKEANTNYGDAVSEYEAKIEQLNNVWVQDKAREQSEIDQLKDQIKNEKVKVYASRLSSSKEKFNDDSQTDEDIDENSISEEQYSGDELSTNIKYKDPQAEIRRLESELARKERELSERSRIFDAKIRELKSGWANDKLALQNSLAEKKAKSKFVPTENDPFKDSQTYRELMQELEYLRDQVSINEKALNRFQNELLKQTSETETLQQKLAERDFRLAEMNALIVAKDQQISALKKELVLKIEEVRLKDAEIKSLKAANSGSLDGANDFNKRVVQIKTPSVPTSSNSVEKLKGLVSELEGSLVTDTPAQQEINDLKGQLQEALQTLQEKDLEIQSLRDQLQNDKILAAMGAIAEDRKSANTKIKKYEEIINDLKERLSVTVAQRQEAYDTLAAATKRLTDMVQENNSRTTVGGVDPSSVAGTVFKKRIEDLNRKIQEQSVDFDLRMKEMTNQLALRDGEIAGLKSQLGLKENQVDQFYKTMEQATEKLNATANAMERNKSSEIDVQNQLDSKVQDNEIDQDNWDQVDSEVLNLRQRVDTLSKELSFTQEELSERTRENAELQARLNQKQSIKAVTEEDISKLEQELAAFRQQSDLTKTTIRMQQESLQKSQKEADRKERSLKSILDQSEKLRKQIEDYKSTVTEKDEQIAFQKKALDHEIKKNDTLTKKLREIQKTASFDQKRDAGANQSMEDLKESLKTYEIRERDYKRQINDIQDQLKSSYVMIEDGEKRVETLKKRLAAREERIAELQMEIDKIKAQFKKTQ